ncbi:MAG: hypothetical protein EA374_08155 [Acholeplasmatales bacterium]|nr:MAG: hypothetical protein EA374_08155 [Acholeplasmatales bacterium]
MTAPTSQKLLVTIIKKGYSKKLVKEGVALGLRGSTVIHGRGTVNPELFESLLGLTYDPDRDVILTLLDTSVLDRVKARFMELGKMAKKNTGIMFVIDVDAALFSTAKLDLNQEERP